MDLTLSCSEHDLAIENFKNVPWSGPHTPTDHPFCPLACPKHYAVQALCYGANVELDQTVALWTVPTFSPMTAVTER